MFDLLWRNNMLYVDLADTFEKQSKGLMFRDYLAEDWGMLFKFDRPQKLKFWNMNTFIPLDVAFIDKDDRIVKIEELPSILNSSQKTVSSDSDCLVAIEANSGFFGSNGIKTGYKIVIDKSSPNLMVKFEK